MKKNFIRRLLIISGIVLAMNSAVLATGTEITYDKNDVTPPWGRIIIQGATEVNNVNYVEREEITVEIYASDDISDTIYYHLSTEPISKTAKITDWTLWKSGATENIKLPSITSTNTIYAAFKDKNGNTSVIYDDSLSHTIVYDVNAGGDATVEGISGVDTTLTYGESHIVTMQKPKWEGRYFLGWSTKKDVTTASYESGDVIAYNELSGLGETITLYAIWTTDESGLPLLSNVVEIGDYVNYPVAYDNVASYGTSYISSYKGWRVIGIESDGTVNLVSAGIPLTYYHFAASNTTQTGSTSATALTTNFLTTNFTTSELGYRSNGFSPYDSLTEVFTNEYTELNSSGKPIVRSMTTGDLSYPIDDEKYENLFTINAYYWLATATSTYRLYYIDNKGSRGTDHSDTFGIRPVVSLKSELRTSGQDMIGAWNMELPR